MKTNIKFNGFEIGGLYLLFSIPKNIFGSYDSVFFERNKLNHIKETLDFFEKNKMICEIDAFSYFYKKYPNNTAHLGKEDRLEFNGGKPFFILEHHQEDNIIKILQTFDGDTKIGYLKYWVNYPENTYKYILYRLI